MALDRRVRKGATDTLTAYFYDGGETPVDKGAVTVSVASDLGTVLQSGGATNTTGTYTFALSATATAALDRLTVTWTSGTEAQQTFVEVVGGFYFELAELRAMNDMSAVTYPTERLRAARQWIEFIIDKEVNASFVRRYSRDNFNFARDPFVATGNIGIDIQPYRAFTLREQYAKAILSLSVAGVALTAPQLAAITVDPVNRIVRLDGGPWSYGYGVVDVRYEAAFTDTCPSDLHDVSLQAARWHLISTDGASGIPNRATSITNDLGNIQLSTAGNRRPTGIPDVDAVIMAYADQVRVPALA